MVSAVQYLSSKQGALMLTMPWGGKILDQMSIEDLSAAVAAPEVDWKVKEKVIEELKQRFEEKMSSGSGTADDERKVQLLGKLSERSLSESEYNELGTLLGVGLPPFEAPAEEGIR